MLSRKTDWSVLAQCDFYAVQNLVQTNDRIAMKFLNPLKEPTFYRKIDSCSVWKEAYRSFCSAYENLKPTFSIRHDNYGGYKLVYTGKDSVTPPHVFKKNPIGIVTAIPKGAVTNLSVIDLAKNFSYWGPSDSRIRIAIRIVSTITQVMLVLCNCG